MTEMKDAQRSLKKRIRLSGHASVPVLFVAFCSLAFLGWLFWGATSQIWAIVWAGVMEPGDQAVPPRIAAAGAWGDSFGAFNALVGALGFGAVTITLRLQYKSLEQQNIDQHIARFEDNFFRLIELMRTLRESLLYEQTDKFAKTGSMYINPGRQRGYDAIEAAYNEVNYWIFKFNGGRGCINRKLISGTYNSYVHHRYEFCFAPYFRIIYTILNNLREDVILSSGQKAKYSNILRSQLTSYEIGLIAFNATSPFAKDLDSLIAEFKLLKYLPQKRRKVLGGVFPKAAYEART